MNANLSPEHKPDGYPLELEQWVALADGRRVFVRPVVVDDAPAVDAALAAADSETVYQRFFRTPVRLNASTLDRLTRLDYQQRLALAAFDVDGQGAAIARYESTEPGVAEVAIVVDPAWRNAGLGSLLLEELELAATQRGIERFTAIYLPSNLAIERLLVRRGFAVRLPDDAVAAAEKWLTAA
ncbi:MAG TPA: GNAT family N-acetyltransferase [Acidimicrobiia bacterium]|jgi:GNAT superfamily N-acetyltransferase|nr:GNAT family N-acetyltransferase [Acidimicrobiia bacterium]